MSKILLIWNAIPEETSAYVLDAGGEAANLAIQSAGKYINGDDLEEGDPIYQLNKMLTDLTRTETNKPLTGPFASVVVCGFIM